MPRAARTVARTRARPGRAAWLRAALWVSLGGLILGVGGVVAPAQAASALPNFAAVRAAHRPSDLVVLDRHGEPVQTVRVDDQRRQLAWVPLEDMSPALLDALVRGEDRRFWSHAGVDWAALAAGAWRSAWDTRTRGASTLTMQLAALLDEDLARPAGGRSLAQKADQALTALQLERRWSKSQILEAYLNRVGWRGEVVGIAAMSQTLFGKHPHGLDRLESALAAALVRGPNAPATRVAERACTLLATGPDASREDCDAVQALAERSLGRQGQPVMQQQIAPHAARALLGPSPVRSAHLQPLPEGLRTQALARGVLDTTLDARIQRRVREAVDAQLAELAGRSVADAAVIVLDNASGEVLAWVGSGGRASSAPAVDAVLARRQAGSTLKPFVYLAAFESGRLTAASLLDDSPAQIPTGAGLWRPQNYDHRHRGWVSARTALASSLNVPAVRAAQGVGLEPLHRTLQAVGLELDQPPGHYGLSLALGSADVTLLALSNAYRTLALQGRRSPVRLHREPWPAARPEKLAALRPVASPAASFIVADILADPAARAGGFGLASVLETRGWAAVKTGTSKDLRDNWCIGFTERHTVGVWVGNAGGEPMHQVSGVTGAAPIWQAVVAGLAAGSPVSRAPKPPVGLVRVALPAAGDDPAGTPQEWLLASTQAGAVVSARRAAWPQAAPAPVGITSPVSGSVIALDPDIPRAAQQLWFEGERGTWVLDGRRLGTASRLAWRPTPGRHRVALLGPDGRERDAVVFDVRVPPRLEGPTGPRP